MSNRPSRASTAHRQGHRLPDEHGIKITEACLREYRINPKPVYLAAARACTRDLAETGLKLA
jgi:hypothetical protein